MPLPPQSPELAAYTQSTSNVRDRVVAYALATWAATSIDDAGATQLATRMAPVVAAGQIQIATLTAAFLARQTGGRQIRLPEDQVTALRGVDPAIVYQRPVITTRTVLKRQVEADAPTDPAPVDHHVDDQPQQDATPVRRDTVVVDLDQARDAGARRLESLVTTDLQLAKVHQARASLIEAERKYYRRVPRAEGACAMCLIASTQRYKIHALMPIHPGCQCGVEELPAGMDLDDNVIDVDLLNATHAKVKEFTGIADRGGRAVDYRKLLITRKHGELGDVLAYRGYDFTAKADIKAQLPGRYPAAASR